jgi:hypothetical protein
MDHGSRFTEAATSAAFRDCGMRSVVGVPNGIRSHRTPTLKSGPTVIMRQNRNIDPTPRTVIPTNDTDTTDGLGILTGILTRTVLDGCKAAGRWRRDFEPVNTRPDAGALRLLQSIVRPLAVERPDMPAL